MVGHHLHPNQAPRRRDTDKQKDRNQELDLHYAKEQGEEEGHTSNEKESRREREGWWWFDKLVPNLTKRRAGVCQEQEDLEREKLSAV